MFNFIEENELYEAVLNGISFICSDLYEGCEEEAENISKVYADKEKEMAVYMNQNGLVELFGLQTAESALAKLGKPQVDLDLGMVTFPNQTFDDTHTIAVAYDGYLDEFTDVLIDE